MSIDSFQLTALVSHVLYDLELHSNAAVSLLLGTAAVESDFGTYLQQLGGGPGCGIFSIEPATERSVWDDHLKYRPDRRTRVHALCGLHGPDPWVLYTNLAYQVIVARLKYRMIPKPLPPARDIEAQAHYWNDYYNCNPVHGHPGEFVEKYHRYVTHVR